MNINEHVFYEIMSGKGMVPMDIFITAMLWFTGAVAILTSVLLKDKENPELAIFRWIFASGIQLLAVMLTGRLIQWGDLPMSPPYAAGLFLMCAGYIGTAWQRVYGKKKYAS